MAEIRNSHLRRPAGRLFFSAVVFLLASLIRRLRSPNPLVDLPYPRQWNTILLGVGLGFFHFCLLSTIILIPQALAIHGFEADQIGPAVIWTALVLIAFIAALLLLHGLDSRLLMATGFACIAAACILNAYYTLPGPQKTSIAPNSSWE